ncbi:MAG TPA: hypothetical protein VE780_02475 [Thermoleophilaceae bacterium]|jgi:hypothetical protein|nr:hypothetical protein [Thermoleophilaceae bacterium]
MERCVEVASFRGDDEPCLVRASLACPLCLSIAVQWSLRVAEWEAWAECACQECGHRRPVWLNSDQALRLSLHGSGLPEA